MFHNFYFERSKSKSFETLKRKSANFIEDERNRKKLLWRGVLMVSRVLLCSC